jgi:DNA-binding PadR family transcriptional regulator
VRVAILSLLSEGPKHGYELMKALETRSGGSYKVSAGTMYPALQQLEDEGMIVSEQKNGKRVYQLTDLGKGELGREGATVDEIWRRASRWGDWAQWMGPQAVVIAGPLGELMKATFRAMKRSGSDPGQRDRIELWLAFVRRRWWMPSPRFRESISSDLDPGSWVALISECSRG